MSKESIDKGLEVVHVCLIKERTLFSEKSLDTADMAVQVMAEELALYDREVLCVLNLQTDNRPINMNIVSMGSINASIVEAREVFKSSILSNANSIMLLHNHPSGNVTPSKEDVQITRRMQDIGELLGIRVLDHIIVGGRTAETYSFCKEGLLMKNAHLEKSIAQRF
jgi:DNA repair proteins